MIRVTQSILGRGDDAREQGIEPGDCMRAAVASVFELPLDEVPHFCDTGPDHGGNGDLWWLAWHGFALHHGVLVHHLEISDPTALSLPGYCLLSGVSPRANPDVDKPMRHTCVGYLGQLAWDPHPSRAGLATIDEADYLVPITHHAHELLARAPVSEAAA